MDKQTFSEKVLKIEKKLYIISNSILKNEKDCEDAVEEAILKAYENLDGLREEKYFKTWLIRILINECYKILNQRKKIENLFDNKFVDEINDYADLYFAIESLSDKIRIVVLLYYIEGYSIDEIKDILKIPTGTVKSRLYIGRKLLKIKLLSNESD
ncbi:MAG: sigma-70 family RNA polymerase sigma factor [Clostridioides sp.]|nr:sigma-70 family RNA polymerase sigma factor [Clostridioides sp.]